MHELHFNQTLSLIVSRSLHEQHKLSEMTTWLCPKPHTSLL